MKWNLEKLSPGRSLCEEIICFVRLILHQSLNRRAVALLSRPLKACRENLLTLKEQLLLAFGLQGQATLVSRKGWKLFTHWPIFDFLLHYPSWSWRQKSNWESQLSLLQNFLFNRENETFCRRLTFWRLAKLSRCWFW